MRLDLSLFGQSKSSSMKRDQATSQRRLGQCIDAFEVTVMESGQRLSVQSYLGK